VSGHTKSRLGLLRRLRAAVRASDGYVAEVPHQPDEAELWVCRVHELCLWDDSVDNAVDWGWKLGFNLGHGSTDSATESTGK